MARDEVASVLAAVGPRLRAARARCRLTLDQVAETTGISASTLSRLESGGRRATLELLLPLARTYRVALDDLVGAPETGDPRVRPRPVVRHGQTVIPLNRRPGGIQAFKQIIRGRADGGTPELRVHEGYEWLYVLDGRLRLLLGDRDLVLTAGEAAEFDTHIPHAFTAAGPDPVEVLSLFGPQGERIHIRARP
jgi:transcriptional regulator with XRE-family HTH domain